MKGKGEDMKFVVYGAMYIKKEWKPFIKETEADSEARVREQVLANIGADHRLRRTQIRIDKVEAN